MRDDAGIAQVWLISPLGGDPEQVTYNPFDVASTLSWSPTGNSIAYVADNSIFTTDIESGTTTRRTLRTADAIAPRPEACVYSPDGTQIAFVRHVPFGGATFNQIFVVALQR
jgi:Tol biopolymer transport system component